MGRPIGPDAHTLAAFLSIVVLLGANFVAVKVSNDELDPLWGAAVRFAIASALLFAATAALRIPLPRGGALRGAILFGLFAFFATYALAYLGLVSAPPSIASVLFATIPLLTLFMAASLGLERLRARGLAGAAVTLAGAGLAFFEQIRANVPPVSVLALLVAAGFAAASGIVVKRAPKAHPIGVNAVAMPVGAVLLLVTSFVAGETHQLPALSATWGALAWLVTSSILAFVLLVWVLSRWSASAASYVSVLAPFVTFVVAAWLGIERITVTFVFGSLLVILGVYMGALWGSVGIAQGRSEKTTGTGQGQELRGQ